MALKVMLISIIILSVLNVVTKIVVNNLSPEEKLIGLFTDNYPTGATVCGFLLVVSWIETIVAVIYWVVTL